MHKARLFKKLPKKEIQCTACQRYCRIKEGKVGFCLSRKNVDGQLYSLNYGFSSGLQLDPIEKKPFYHFHPGTSVLSIGSWGCNFRCKQCQNWHCSWGDLAKAKLKTGNWKLETGNDYISPDQLVNLAIRQNSPGIAFTYNEPVIWPEYVYDVARLARQKGLYAVFVSNGSWSKEALGFYGRVLDAANIDFKGWGEAVYTKQGAFWGGFLSNLVLAYKKYRIHLELTTLLIPGVNDKEKDLEKIADFIVKNLGPEVPWHLSRFSPSHAPNTEFQKILPTSKEALEKAYQIGKEAGLCFVYVWAPPVGEEIDFFGLGDTYCPKCKKLVIKRSGWQPELVGVKKDRDKGVCKFCGADLYLKF